MTRTPVDHSAARGRVIVCMTGTVNGLSAETAAAALQTARCSSGQALKALDQHLAGQPLALLTPASQVPLALLRLTQVLQGEGFADVAAPVCAGCGLAKQRLPSIDDTGGRLCDRCASARVAPQPCARCGRSARIRARRAEGGICERCHRSDPLTHEPCAACARTQRPVRRLPDGTALCSRCAPRPVHQCISCAASRPAHALTSDGPICETCYRRSPRACGVCGQTKRIHKKATDTDPDLCGTCYVGVDAVCSICDRLRPCRRDRSTNSYLCRGCRPVPQRSCAICQNITTIRANWPLGPVCGRCYRHQRSRPQHCPSCSSHRVLVARNDAGELICGPCGGVELDYRCRICHTAGDLYADHTCDRCVLKARLADLLAGPDGQIDHRLAALHRALESVPRPRSALVWLWRHPAARLLIELAERPELIGHDYLDHSPHRQAAHYLRGLLVHTGALPERDDILERIGPWSERLTGAPSSCR